MEIEKKITELEESKVFINYAIALAILLSVPAACVSNKTYQSRKAIEVCAKHLTNNSTMGTCSIN
jgi:hypothetical protein